MTPEEFVAIGKRLFGRGPSGYGWQAEMNRQTGTPVRTIQAWASGGNPIPGIVAWALTAVLQSR